jgi:hypothetical protein
VSVVLGWGGRASFKVKMFGTYHKEDSECVINRNWTSCLFRVKDDLIRDKWANTEIHSFDVQKKFTLASSESSIT